MKQLPHDLKICLMKNIDEFSSLWSLIRTSTSMNEAFKVSKKSILSSVIRRALNPELLCDALALHHAASLASREFYRVKGFLERWTPPCEYPSPDSLVFNSIARKQALVEWFLRDLCGSMVRRYPYDRPPGATHQYLGPSEITRVHRAFYRFDLYAILFADQIYFHVDYDDQLDMDETREVYLDRMPPWEIEELTCIHAHLHRRLEEQYILLSPPQTISGDQSLRPSPPNLFFKHYSTRECLLSHGLDFLYWVLTTAPERKRRVVQAKATVCKDQRFLGNVLRLGSSVWSMVQEKPDFSERIRLNNHDGPSAGWLWVHENKELTRNWWSFKADLQGWGYCLWDRQRMERLVELDRPFDEIIYALKLPWKVRNARSESRAHTR